jgi:hypothetical protein
LFFILLLEPKGIFSEYDKSAPLGRDAPRDMRKIQDQGQLWNRQLLAFFFVGGQVGEFPLVFPVFPVFKGWVFFDLLCPILLSMAVVLGRAVQAIF